MSAPSSSADWIANHRAIWARKGGVRAVYAAYFRCLRDACVPGEAVVELGCGPGFFKEHYPEIIATDVVANPYADRIVDAATLPFPDAELGSLVMLDVFHHLPEPGRFLGEAARALRPGGRLVMIEPWIGLAGRLLYTFVHHETCDVAVPPDAPWGESGKDPMEGNVALPFLYFRTGGRLEQMGLPLRVIRREPFSALPWVLSGGFQPLGLLPAAMLPVAESLDRLLSLVPALTAVRCFLVVEKAG